MRTLRVVCLCLIAAALLILPASAKDTKNRNKKMGHAVVVQKAGSSTQVKAAATCFVTCDAKVRSLQLFLKDLTPNESCCQHCLDQCQVSACQSTSGGQTVYCFAD
jgi:hypothetical protein